MKSAAALLLLLLSACTTLPVVEPPPATQYAWETWLLSGRIAVRQGEEGWHGGIVWQTGHDAATLRVTGPLGRLFLNLDYGYDHAVLRMADGQVRHSSDARTLLHETTGLDLPLSGLRYWVQGYADPASETEFLTDANGHLKELHQSGWHIVYDKYRLFQDQLRPTRIKLSRADVAVKLVLKSWQSGLGRLP